MAEQVPSDEQKVEQGEFDALSQEIVIIFNDIRAHFGQDEQTHTDINWLAMHIASDERLPVESNWGEAGVENRSGKLTGAYYSLLDYKHSIKLAEGSPLGPIEDLLTYCEDRVAETDSSARGHMAAYRFEKEGRYQDVAVAIGGVMTEFYGPNVFPRKGSSMITTPMRLVNGLRDNEVDSSTACSISTAFYSFPDTLSKVELYLYYAQELKNTSQYKLWETSEAALQIAAEVASRLDERIDEEDLSPHWDDDEILKGSPKFVALRRIARTLDVDFPQLKIGKASTRSTQEFKILPNDKE